MIPSRQLINALHEHSGVRSGLLPYQQRVVEEYEELERKTLALGNFRQSIAHAVLDKDEQDRLSEQW